MALFTLRLPDDLAARFDVAAAQVGGRSQALRALIERGVRMSPDASALPVERSRGSNRVTVRLRDEELAQLDAAATERGVKRSDWIAAVIRSRLPLAVPPIDQRQTLIDIRRELRAIGKNVNQAVHALHSANMEGSRLDLVREAERVAFFQSSITEQIKAVGAALKGDLDYWRGEV